MWRVNREYVVLLAGAAAAVLQVAHPQVAMGVYAHSDFQNDPTGRLQRTLDAVYAVAFGTPEQAAAMQGRVAAMHAKVRGEGYSAFDADAQLWVLATLIMGSVSMYRRFVGPLSDAELNQLLLENRVFGKMFGVKPDAVPDSWPEFLRYWNSMLHGPVLGAHPLCAPVAQAVLCPTHGRMKMLAPVFRALALEFLPPALQLRLGLRAGRYDQNLWQLMDVILPNVLGVLPPSLRFVRSYRNALLRIGGEPDVTLGISAIQKPDPVKWHS